MTGTVPYTYTGVVRTTHSKADQWRPMHPACWCFGSASSVGVHTNTRGTRVAQRTVVVYSVLWSAVRRGFRLCPTHQMESMEHAEGLALLYEVTSTAAMTQRTAAFMTSMRSTVLMRLTLGMPVISCGAKCRGSTRRRRNKARKARTVVNQRSYDTHRCMQ